mmetsp:Transcript_30607/g.49049  ORF Transcript_30607/g.49049 Transcript_30607/m.49049 type:complete len:108 (+) Transcript_30607:94-417(+)
MLSNMIEATMYALDNFTSSMNLTKKMVLSVEETGWPSNGTQKANETTAKTFVTSVHEFLSNGGPKSLGSRLRSFYLFEAFDEGNKPHIKQPAEPYWGILHANGTTKW